MQTANIGTKYICPKTQFIIKNTVNRCIKFTKLSTLHCKSLSSGAWIEKIGFNKKWSGMNGTSEQLCKKILYILNYGGFEMLFSYIANICVIWVFNNLTESISLRHEKPYA